MLSRALNFSNRNRKRRAENRLKETGWLRQQGRSTASPGEQMDSAWAFICCRYAPASPLLEASTEPPQHLQSVHSSKLHKGRQLLFPHLSIKIMEAFTPLGSQQNISHKHVLCQLQTVLVVR